MTTTETPQDEAIKNVNLDKVDFGLSKKNLLALKGWAPGLVEGISKTEVVRELQKYYVHTCEQEKREETDLLECEICGAYSDGKATSDCPFCGHTDEETPQKDKSEMTATTSKGRPRLARGQGKAKDSKTKDSKTKDSKTKDSKTKDSIPLEVADPAATEIVATETQLDEAVAEVKRLTKNTVHGWWLTGRKLAEINENRYWNAHKAKDGKTSLYKSWGEFCEKELGYTAQYANRCIAVGLGFTEEQIEGIDSFSQLGIIVKVPAEQRMPLLQMAREGATKSKLAAEVAKIPERAEGRSGVNPKSGKAMGRQKGNENKGGRKPSESKQKDKPAASGEITAVLTKARTRIKLYARGDEKKPAKNLGQDPHGELECANGVKMLFRLMKNTGGELFIAVETKRVE